MGARYGGVATNMGVAQLPGGPGTFGSYAQPPLPGYGWPRVEPGPVNPTPIIPQRYQGGIQNPTPIDWTPPFNPFAGNQTGENMPGGSRSPRFNPQAGLGMNPFLQRLLMQLQFGQAPNRQFLGKTMFQAY